MAMSPSEDRRPGGGGQGSPPMPEDQSFPTATAPRMRAVSRLDAAVVTCRACLHQFPEKSLLEAFE